MLQILVIVVTTKQIVIHRVQIWLINGGIHGRGTTFGTKDLTTMS